MRDLSKKWPGDTWRRESTDVLAYVWFVQECYGTWYFRESEDVYYGQGAYLRKKALAEEDKYA